MEYKYLDFEVEDGLGTLTMNRPPGNAIKLHWRVGSWETQVVANGLVIRGYKGLRSFIDARLQKRAGR